MVPEDRCRIKSEREAPRVGLGCSAQISGLVEVQDIGGNRDERNPTR